MAVSRRSFLKGAAAVTAITAAGGVQQAVAAEQKVTATSGGLNKWRGRVAINFNKDAVTSANKADAAVISKMMDDTIMLLAGEKEVGAAWKAIFPSSITATSKIAIKTNFYAKTICPPPCALLAMVQGLAKMDFNGSPYTGKITICEGMITPNTFDAAGYVAADFSKAHPKGEVLLERKACVKANEAAGGKTECLEALNLADFYMNVFSARGHDSYAEGVSLGFKSHFGSYAAAMDKHSNPALSQYVRDLHCTGQVLKKQVLSVSCAFFCNNEGTGMGTTSAVSFATYVKTMDEAATCTSPSTIIMSTDAISCEMQAIKLLRLNKGGKFAVADMPKYLRASAGVTGALSDKTYDIGEIDEAKMEIRKMINGNSTPVITGAKASVGSSVALLQATPLRGQGSTHFEFRLPAAKLGMMAQLSVTDLQGRQVFSKELPVNGALNHFSWDQRTSSGAKVAGGRYIASIKAGALARSAPLILQ